MSQATAVEIKFKLINRISGYDEEFGRDTIINFLHKHLEVYGDEKSAISKCLEYVMSPSTPGGLILLAFMNNDLVGAAVINATGMSEYIPENILVYLAVDGSKRGAGIGQQIMNHVVRCTKGDIALHVEKDNPAARLYERIGFEKKYIEMRLKRS